MQRFWRFVNEQPRKVKVFSGILFSLIAPALSIIFSIININAAQSPISTALNLTIIMMSIQIAIIFNVAWIWIFDYYLPEQEKIRIETFTDQLTFARKKHEVLSSISHLPTRYSIYASAHSDYFLDNIDFTAVAGTQIADTSAEALARNIQRTANHNVIEALAKLVLRSDDCGIRLFLQFNQEDEEEVKQVRAAIKTRRDLCVRAGESMGKSFLKTQFSYKWSSSRSTKEYLVVGEHVFKTIKKTKASSGHTTYVYIRSKKLAETYTSWMKDIYEYGNNEGHVRDIDNEIE